MSIFNHNLQPEQWTDINTVASIMVGGHLVISNLGRTDIRIIQSATEPLSIVGDIITPNNKPYARATVSGGDKIWVYAPYECEIAIQEIL